MVKFSEDNPDYKVIVQSLEELQKSALDDVRQSPATIGSRLRRRRQDSIPATTESEFLPESSSSIGSDPISNSSLEIPSAQGRPH
jgi:hypothetical protein